jgi:hypothetical protein
MVSSFDARTCLFSIHLPTHSLLYLSPSTHHLSPSPSACFCRLSASTDESSRLRGALVECKDGSRRNADLADATARNLKQAENEKVEVESERDAAVR